MNEEYYINSELKFSIKIECEDFDMGQDPWTAVLRNGEKSITFSKTENTVVDEDGNWYLLVDTSLLGAGKCYLITEIDVPDSDFPDGYRHEVHKQTLMTLKRV